MSKFKINDETGKEREATVIANISFDSIYYSIYAINRDSQNINIFVSKLIKNVDNTVLLVDIYDPEKKVQIDSIVKKVIKAKGVNELDDERIDIIDDIDYINSTKLAFTTYKTYVFSIKNDLYEKVFEMYNVNDSSISDDENSEYLKLTNDIPRFMDDIPQKIDESENTLFEIDEKKASQISDVFKKISIEKLDVSNEDSLKELFDEKKVVTSNSKGFASDLILSLIGISAFIMTIIFLILQLKMAS